MNDARLVVGRVRYAACRVTCTVAFQRNSDSRLNGYGQSFVHLRSDSWMADVWLNNYAFPFL